MEGGHSVDAETPQFCQSKNYANQQLIDLDDVSSQPELES